MTRLIDADAFKKENERLLHCDFPYLSEITLEELIDDAPTVDAIPTEFVMEIGCLEFVCDELTDDGEWCSERCRYSEPQPECIHRYIDRIWRKEHDKID